MTKVNNGPGESPAASPITSPKLKKYSTPASVLKRVQRFFLLSKADRRHTHCPGKAANEFAVRQPKAE